MAGIIKRAHKLRGRLTARDHLHVTLFPLSGLPEPLVEKACKAVAETRAAPSDVSFDRSVSFRGRSGSRPFVLTGESGPSPFAFRRSIAAAMARKGLRFLGCRDFTPHVTLLFDNCAVEQNPFGPIGWIVRDIVLVRSNRGHAHLARWVLQV